MVEAKELERLVSDAKPQVSEHPMPNIASSTTAPVSNNHPPSNEQTTSRGPSPSTESPMVPPISSGSVDDGEKPQRQARPGSALMNQFQNWVGKRKLGVPGQSESPAVTTEQGDMPGPNRTRTPQPNVTPLSNIGELSQFKISGDGKLRPMQNRTSTRLLLRAERKEAMCFKTGRVCKRFEKPWTKGIVMSLGELATSSMLVGTQFD